MVERSLEQLAADRGVTICFADLDGADGLWVAEERTILVNKGLPEHQVVEVLEHELAHVAIDDGHAAVDAAVRRRPSGSARWAAILSAAASVGLLTGVYVTVSHDTSTATQQQEQQAPPSADAPEPIRSAGPATLPPSSVSTEIVAGPVRISTVTVTAPYPPTPTATAKSTAPVATATRGAVPVATRTVSASPSVAGGSSTPTVAVLSPSASETATPAVTTTPPGDTAQAGPTG